MASDRKDKQSNSIPIQFFDNEESKVPEPAESDAAPNDGTDSVDAVAEASPASDGGPALAELIATRSELKRLQAELREAKDSLARRQADFENYRKRIERERGEAHNRIVAEVAKKLLPVLDNLSRALEAERSVEASESKEFRHFLHGVELIDKQLSEVLESFGVQPIAAVGERFDPHLHEAVVTEPSDEYEPDIVVAEMARGYRIGDRLLRPAMVKVAARAAGEDEE